MRSGEAVCRSPKGMVLTRTRSTTISTFCAG